ncbi:MAG TPA: NYN domain-containing protein, partial [Thermoanaerobaculia bacterium]|nr:NYN domain-containing protein [Thermoanaerobaculia bacterium]
MTDPSVSPPHVRTALFVDFDNIYLGLQHEDPRAAEQFATNPSRWLHWLQDNLPWESPTSGPNRPRRKILFRRCYLNPSQFGRFRPFFSRSAFEVVDCPPLTSGGKTSADIHMVMDILDTLGHATRFDEFIILSGDADFTPVLLRLSKHDRRSAVLAVGPASAAYKAACDLLIDQDTFLEDAIGVTDVQSNRGGNGQGAATAPQSATPTTATAELLRRIADKVYERASESGELVATALPAIFRQFPEFTTNSNWLGFYSLRSMTTAVVQARRDLVMVDGDPWIVTVSSREEEGEPDGGREVSAAYTRSQEPPVDVAEMTEKILEFLRGVVESSETPVPMARAAQMVITRFGDQVLTSRWAGAGTFRDLLEGRENPGFSVSSLKPGYLYDGERHQLPSDGRPDELSDQDPALSSLAYRVHQLTDTPYLTPTEYGEVFRRIAEEVNEHGYFLTRTSKAVRDRCIEEGASIARASVNFILRGITFAGHRFGQNGPDDPMALGSCFFRNVLGLCESAGLQLASEDRDLLAGWILSDLKAR